MKDKEIKTRFKEKASNNPEKYYPVDTLKSEGFERKQCKCGTFFWVTNQERNVCDNPSCSGGFRFFNRKIKKRMDYIILWKNFASLFKSFGYTPIKRYPVVARWRDDVDFVQASIYDFQPWVVNGEVEPPANPLVVPQLCLRFNDIDNVGVTGAHYTLFSMIGQHAFMPPEKFDQEKYFQDIHNWLKIGLGLCNEEIVFHEDVWAGGGNFGPCIEYFSYGLELGNQVYILFEQTSTGIKELKMKVLDMGMGHERNAWFTNPVASSYELIFPTVIDKLKRITGVKTDPDIVKKLLPFLSRLNIDETENIENVWEDISKKIGVQKEALKNIMLPPTALYSIAEHSRALLVAITDGALPSNVGGGYNLRVILRRALGFIDRFGWDIDLSEICELHAKYLKPIYPELTENLEDVKKIIDVETKRYKQSKQRNRKIISKLIKKEKFDTKKLVQLYETYGILPEAVKDEATRIGISVSIPENFYALVTQKQFIAKKESKKIEFDIESIPETELCYMEDEKTTEFEAKILKIVDKNVILNKTYFYPTSGGQIHDVGTIDGIKVVDVIKEKGRVIHVLEKEPRFEETVHCSIDWNSRWQLMQHHTATHIVNASARAILGNHVFQAGSSKTLEKATLDITHYESLSDEEIKNIEKRANKIIEEEHPIEKIFIPRNKAEKLYGFKIYQGGAVPGKNIRIVNIKDVDVEACGGTHVDNTKDVEKILILGSERIQDGVVRLKYVAGNVAKKLEQKIRQDVEEIANILGVDKERIVENVRALVKEYKVLLKEKKKNMKKNAALTIKELRKHIKNNTLIAKVNNGEIDMLEEISRRLTTEKTLIILFGVGKKTVVLVGVGKKRNIVAKEILDEVLKYLGGKGGGQKNIAQGIVENGEKIDYVIKKLEKKYARKYSNTDCKKD